MSDHTPGPWDLVAEKGFGLAASWVIEARPQAERSIALIMSTEANARLIAAAPDLLAAVHSLLRVCDDLASQQAMPDESWRVDAQAAFAAIAKAKGR